MKKTVIFLIVALFYGCEKNPSSPCPQDNEDFTTWSNALTLNDVKAIYTSGDLFMSDARGLSSILPFSYKDSITSLGAIDPSVNFPNTTSEGITSIKYKDSLIFQNSWNRYYMDGASSITDIKYGESDGFKFLKIANASYFPPNQEHPSGSYGLENRLFILNDINLIEFNLKGYYALSEIKSSCTKGVVILYCFDFVRSNPKYQYLILLDLPSKENRVFRFDYNESLIGG